MNFQTIFLFCFLMLKFLLQSDFALAQTPTQQCINLFESKMVVDGALPSPPGRQGTGLLKQNWRPDDPFVVASTKSGFQNVNQVIDALRPLPLTLDGRLGRTLPVLRGENGVYQINVQRNLLLKGDPALWPLIDAVGATMIISSVRGDNKPPYLVYFHIGQSRAGTITHSFLVFDNIDAASRYIATHDFDLTELEKTGAK
jgi:hypothetical protein